MAAGTYASPAFHDSYWGSKFLGWVVLLVVSVFVPNEVFDDHGYLWVARVGGFVFVVLQQVLLIDLAYYMNDSLVTLADSGEVSEWCGMPSPLVALIAAAAALFLVAVVGVGLLFAYFGTDCTSPDTILGLTVALCVVATACQLFISKDSNLLTSATVSAYLVYLAASALTANPVPSCNPFYSNTSDWLSIVVGLAFTVAALVYTIYSASNNVQYLGGGRGDAGKASDNGPGGAMMNKILTGQLEGSAAPADKSYGSNGAAGDEERPAAPPGHRRRPRRSRPSTSSWRSWPATSPWCSRTGAPSRSRAPRRRRRRARSPCGCKRRRSGRPASSTSGPASRRPSSPTATSPKMGVTSWRRASPASPGPS